VAREWNGPMSEQEGTARPTVIQPGNVRRRHGLDRGMTGSRTGGEALVH
jgi:hypothetical protein